MKFKDKDGNVFEDIKRVFLDYCRVQRCPCLISRTKAPYETCSDWWNSHPAEAACLVGYEVVEDAANDEQMTNKLKGDDMDKQKPLKDWTLEEIRVECGKHPVECTGCVAYLTDECFFTEFERVYPDAWHFYDQPCFTDEEVADARAIIRLFGPDNWTHIGKDEYGYPQLEDKDDESEICRSTIGLLENLFPSIRPGQSVKLSEIVGGGTDG